VTLNTITLTLTQKKEYIYLLISPCHRFAGDKTIQEYSGSISLAYFAEVASDTRKHMSDKE
jgi:hypothetical protein